MATDSKETDGRSEGRVISLSELAKHNTERDCWVAIDGQVYDVTGFLADHPGGPASITDHAGQDATEGFEDTGHSSAARAMLPKYHIGRLEGATSASSGAPSSAAGTKTASKPSSSDAGGSLLSYVVPVLILAGALWYQFMYLPQQQAANSASSN